MEPVYDRFAGIYDRLFAPFERRFLSRWRAETLAEVPPDSAILEIGAGTGANFQFYPNSRTAVSSELSLKMLAVASAKPGGGFLIQADACSIPFADNSFDAAFATLVFCSIPDPGTAFGELRRVIRPAGTLVLLEHVRPPGWPGYLFDSFNALTVALIDDHFNRETADAAQSAGFKLLEVRRKARGIVNLIICRNP
jgi:ubiquinone/menaquinone biosynthesis C-methylase UbiE